MAATDFYYLGTASDNTFTTNANWDSSLGGSPDDDTSAQHTLYFNKESANQLTTSISRGTEDYSIIADDGFGFWIGTSGTPFVCDDMSLLLWQANSTTSSYINPVDLGRAVIDTQSTKNDALVLNPTTSHVSTTVKNGRMSFGGTAILTSSIITVGSPGATADTAYLTIPSGLTATSCILVIYSGKVITSTTIPTVIMSGGELVLNGAAGVSTRLLMAGGVCYWDAASTIASAEVNGGTLKTRFNKRGRTFTAGSVYKGGLMDFSVGGLGMTFTAAPIDYTGGTGVRYPMGSKISRSV